MGEDVWKWYTYTKEVNIQNTQITHTTQYQKKLGLENAQRPWLNVFPKQTYKWPSNTWKDA